MVQQLLFLWSHFNSRRRYQFSLLLVLLIIASLSEIVSISAIIPFLTVLTNPEQIFNNPFVLFFADKLGISDPDQMLLPLTALFSLAALISGVLRWALLWGQIKLGHAIGADLSFNIYRKTLYQPYSVHISRNSGEIIAAVAQKANEVVFQIIIPVMIVISSIVLFLSIMIVFFYIEPMIALYSFAGFGAIYLTIILITKKKLAVNSERIALEQNQVIKSLQEGLGGIRDVLLDSTQETYCKIFRNADLPLRKSRASVQIISGTPRFGIEAIGMVLIAVLAYSIADAGDFAQIVPVLGALALCAQRLLPVMQQAYANLTLIKGGQSSLRDALVLLSQPMPQSRQDLGRELIGFHKNIILEEISFNYSEQGKYVLEDVNMEIRKGDRIGIIGKTGSGKSTLVDIVMGLLYPIEGLLKVDGKIIDSQNIKDWQLHIAHVPQSIFLTDGTITENIAFGIAPENIQMEKVRVAAGNAQIASAVEKMKEGYETIVGERGVRLSGGQRQRIGIARALYKNPGLLILDEATSSLDEETESAVMDVIDNLKSEITILVIAHRLSTLKSCNHIFELKNGKIAGSKIK